MRQQRPARGHALEPTARHAADNSAAVRCRWQAAGGVHRHCHPPRGGLRPGQCIRARVLHIVSGSTQLPASEHSKAVFLVAFCDFIPNTGTPLVAFSSAVAVTIQCSAGSHVLPATAAPPLPWLVGKCIPYTKQRRQGQGQAHLLSKQSSAIAELGETYKQGGDTQGSAGRAPSGWAAQFKQGVGATGAVSTERGGQPASLQHSSCNGSRLLPAPVLLVAKSRLLRTLA